MGNLSSYTYDIFNVDREVYYVYNQTTHEYEYTFYQTGNQDIFKHYHIDETDSLRRVNCIELVIGSISFTEHIAYRTSASGRGNTSPMIASIQYRRDDTVQYSMNYTYDDLGNIASITKTVGQNMVEWHTYLYDGFNRLTREMVDLGSTEYTKFYTYDSRGNITAIKTYQFLINVPDGTPYQETDITYITTGWKDQISVIREYENGALQNTLAYSYDAIGNIISIDSNLVDQSFVWEGRRLVEHNLGGETYTYTYDDQGMRTSKSDGSDTTYYFLDGRNVLAEKKGSSIIHYTYDVDGSILSMNYQGNEYFYMKNLQGDILSIVDSSGGIVAGYTYDAWGNIIDQWGNSGIDDINPYRYRSYRYDQETGLYYLNSRYYDPHLGRFISADSIGYLDPSSETGLNLYAYCGNNPLMYLNSDCYSSSYISSSLDDSSILNGSSVGSSAVNRGNPINYTLAKGSFRNGILFGTGSVTGLYLEGHARAQFSLKNSKFILGVFGKFSLLNIGGQIGIGSNDINISLKGVADIGTVTGMVGLLVDPSNDLFFFGVEAKASVITARAGVQFELFGLQIEGGASIDALAIGGRLGVGKKEGEFYFRSGAAVLFGYDFYIRIKY